MVHKRSAFLLYFKKTMYIRNARVRYASPTAWSRANVPQIQRETKIPECAKFAAKNQNPRVPASALSTWKNCLS